MKEKILKKLSEWIPFWECWKKSATSFFNFLFEKYQLIAVVSALCVGLWISLSLSHLIFLHSLGYSWRELNFSEASPWTFLRVVVSAYENPDSWHHWVFSALAPLFAILILMAMMIRKSQSNLFGDAHWASYFEAKKAGLLSENGIILGKKWGKYLRVGGFEHVFVFAPSGSGKTESIAMSTLLTDDSSMVVQDPKGTLKDKTSAYRQKYGHACFVWALGARDRKSHAYNPMDFVSKDKILRIDDLQKIATIFIPDNPKIDPIWTTQPRELFVAIALYLLDTHNKIKTIGEMVRTVKNTLNFSEWIKTIILERDDLDPVCYRNFASFLQTEHRLQTNILKSFLSYFELFENPLIDAATAHSDFDITQLKKKRMTIYVSIGANNLDRFSPLLTVFYQQVLDVSTQEIPDPILEPYGIVLVLDEFGVLRKMPVIQKGLGFSREYRVRMMAFIQDIPQLYETYGVNGAKAFINSKYRVAFATNDYDSAVLISHWLSDQTVEQTTHNTRNGRMSDGGQSTSVTKRPLLLPGEIMKLSKKKMIIAVENSSPILANKNFWFSDPHLKHRNLGAIDLPTLEILPSSFDHEALKVAVQELAAREVNAQKSGNQEALHEEEID